MAHSFIHLYLNLREREPSAKFLSHTWWRNFRQRHRDELTMRTPDIIDRGRAICAREKKIAQFFILLRNVLEEHRLTDKTRQIYNCDELGFQMGKPPKKVLVSKGCRHPAPGTIRVTRTGRQRRWR